MSWIPKFLINKLRNEVLSSTEDQRIHLEAAKRSSKKGRVKSGEIIRSNTLFRPLTLDHWNLAVSTAKDPLDPDFTLLAELYKNLLLDNHLVSTIENRIYRVAQSRFVIKTQNDEENPELKKLFKSTWFEEFIKYALWSKFTGVKVLELFELDDDLELRKVVNIPMAHLLPKKGIFTKEEGDDTGWNYKEGPLQRFYIQIGEDDDIGMLADIAPMVLAKKLAIGSWLDFVQKFGIPARWVITDREDTNRLDELFKMMQDMVNNHFAVLRGNERIEIAETPGTDAHKVFNELISRINSEISKRILGQDGTSDHNESTGTYGSLKVLQEVANDRHESDKIFIKNIINKLLFPKLAGISSYYSGIANHYFDWDNTEELSQKDFINNVVALTNAGYQLDAEQIQERTGLTIVEQQNKPANKFEDKDGDNNDGTDDEDGKNPKKKSR